MAATISFSIGGIVCGLIPLFTLTLAKLCPSGFISPVMISLSLIVVLIHAALLEALRDNIQFLYIVYIVIAVGLSVLCQVPEPYFTFTLRERITTAPMTTTPEPTTDEPGRVWLGSCRLGPSVN